MNRTFVRGSIGMVILLTAIVVPATGADGSPPAAEMPDVWLSRNWCEIPHRGIDPTNPATLVPDRTGEVVRVSHARRGELMLVNRRVADNSTRGEVFDIRCLETGRITGLALLEFDDVNHIVATLAFEKLNNETVSEVHEYKANDRWIETGSKLFLQLVAWCGSEQGVGFITGVGGLTVLVVTWLRNRRKVNGQKGKRPKSAPK